MKAEMAAAGVSAAGVTTISTFMESHKPQKGGNRAAGKAEFDAMLATLTEADRTAFQKMMQNKPPRIGK
ncbi:Protein CBG19069 [Caenorhabditis briggsae]|nr:Protein CBG19069 [Caenorhabditis briggsae]CAP36376.2 Protein CBG19069 [Caenorhabditis briggsae]